MSPSDAGCGGAAHRVTAYRKRPVEVEAVRFDGTNFDELASFTGKKFWPVHPDDRGDDPDMEAEVLSTQHSTWVGVTRGKWIIRDAQGEIYPCDPDVFEATYEAVTS